MAQLPIPWDWDGETWRCYAIEWPYSPLWEAILWGFITTPSRGRFWKASTGSITDTQQIGFEIITRNEAMEEVLMSCNDNAIAALQAIADQIEALVNKPCCPQGTTTGSRGAGSVQVTPNPYNQEETPETPPPGFDNMTQFEAHKCNAAQDIITALRGDLLGLEGLSYAGATPTGLVGAMVLFLLTPIPFDDLIALAAYLIYSAYSYTFLAQMSAYMGDNNNDLLCVLFDSPTVESAENDFLAALEAIAQAEFPSSDDADFVMGAIEHMLGYDALNKLFEDVPTTSQSADCSGCGSPSLAYVDNFNGCIGTVLSGDFLEAEETEVESCASVVFGTNRGNILLRSTAGTTNRTITITDVSGTNDGMVVGWTSNGVPQTNDNYTNLADLIGEVYTADGLHIIRGTPSNVSTFTVTVTVEE